ncbi:hypothetical protein [Zhongshania aliphaticivorans]|uniref:hypothetical protein n=1 Tax=Zhongshania aliphaticivorans TaxID=1470434 RepID=UPI0012E6EF58|nr:hypothetical protein [Zhongshania aliphaticivorans]CAA0100977.1 Uncharacterised protein [Zhongshania aliphaticivorans]
MKKISTKPLLAAAAIALSSSLSQAQLLGLPIPSIGSIAPSGLVTSITEIAVGEGLPIVTNLLFSSPLTPLIVGLAPQAAPLTSILLGNPVDEVLALISLDGSSPLGALGTLPGL